MRIFDIKPTCNHYMFVQDIHLHLISFGGCSEGHAFNWGLAPPSPALEPPPSTCHLYNVRHQVCSHQFLDQTQRRRIFVSFHFHPSMTKITESSSSASPLRQLTQLIWITDLPSTLVTRDSPTFTPVN